MFTNSLESMEPVKDCAFISFFMKQLCVFAGVQIYSQWHVNIQVRTAGQNKEVWQIQKCHFEQVDVLRSFVFISLVF